MKKYTIRNCEEFCKNALGYPPFEEFENGSIDEKEWYDTHQIHIIVGNHDMELEYNADNATEIEGAIKEMYEMEKDMMDVVTEFKTKLAEAFKTHMFMQDRDHHTINELLYVLEHDSRFGKEDFNISIQRLDNRWWSIPGLDAFVDIKTRGVWFDDADIEFEIEECDEEKYNCITVYEREVK